MGLFVIKLFAGRKEEPVEPVCGMSARAKGIVRWEVSGTICRMPRWPELKVCGMGRVWVYL